MASLASWCFRHRFVVIGLWVALLAALGVASTSAGTAYNDSFSLPGTESSKALDLLRNSFPAASGDTDTVVLHSTSGTLTDPATKQQVSDMLATVAALPQIAAVVSPYDPQGAMQINPDGTTAFASVTFAKPGQELTAGDIQPLIDAGSAIRSDSLEVEFGGNGIAQLNGAPTSGSEAIGLVAAAVVLLIAFGSLLSMLIPIVSAIFALGAALLSIGLLSHVLSIGSISPTIAALVGLGVGIDYALFIVTRYRTGLRRGMTPPESAVIALNTSGRAVIFAGGTVAIAMGGLLILRVQFLTGVAIASAVMIVFAVLVAVTLLPAFFGLLGMRVLSRRERRTLAATGPESAEHSETAPTGAWARWAVFVQRRPATLGVIALAVMLALAAPTLSLRLGNSDQGNDPASSTTRKAYDLLADGFGPGSNGPLQLVAEVAAPRDGAALDALVTTLASTPGIASAVAFPAAPDAAVRIVQVTPTTSPQSAETADLIDTLRSDVIPQAEVGTTLQVYVGGATAIFKDFAGVLTGKLPLFITVIIILGCLLLMLAFRSIVIPLTAAAMNLLAAGASFGVVVAFFQWGWGSEALGLGAAGPVEAFLPVMMLAILFGLSMDYQVFLVSRMHEEWTHTHDNHRAVRVGQTETARVITAAATIMIFVFIAFVFGGQRVIAEFGIGLSAAIALDAFILRTILVPAAMHLFGRANWWLPGWLDRAMPQLSVEPYEAPAGSGNDDDIESDGHSGQPELVSSPS